jgi:hypothetical protein
LDIDGWLRRIGLAQYAEMFRANDIDGEMLGRLTNDDLKDIGVASFGHRKKLLEAIAALVAAPDHAIRRKRTGKHLHASRLLQVMVGKVRRTARS